MKGLFQFSKVPIRCWCCKTFDAEKWTQKDAGSSNAQTKEFPHFWILQKAFLGLNNSQDLILKQYHYFYFALLRNEVNNYSWYFLKQRSNNGQQVEETLNIWRLTLPLNRDANWSIQAWVWVSNRIFKPTTTCFKKPPIPNHIQKPYDAFRSTVSHDCYRP